MIDIKTTPKVKRKKKRKPDLFPWIVVGLSLVGASAAIAWLLFSTTARTNNNTVSNQTQLAVKDMSETPGQDLPAEAKSKASNQTPVAEGGTSEKSDQDLPEDAKAVQPESESSNISGLEIISMRMKLADFHKADIEKQIKSNKGRLLAHKAWMSYQTSSTTYSDNRIIEEFKIRFPDDFKVMNLD